MRASHAPVVEGDGLMDAVLARRLLDEIGRELADKGITAEIAIYGGVAMLLQFGARAATRDIDFTHVDGNAGVLQKVAEKVGARHGMPQGWFNDSVRMFVSDRPELMPFGDFPAGGRTGLRVLLASPRYILAMKLLAMRSPLETNDMRDVWHLLDECRITTADEAVAWISRFYPGDAMQPDKEIRLRELVADKAAGMAYDPMRYW